MASILQTTISKCIFLTENFCDMIEISLQYVLKCPNDNSLALVRLVAWR